MSKPINDFELFLERWARDYKAKVLEFSLFRSGGSASWSLKKKQYFANIFYHVRGHFDGFLWYMGNYAPNRKFKEVILKNISEEFSLNGRSHELLYLDFAKALDLDLLEETVAHEYNLSFIKRFNKKHLEWLTSNDWQSCFAAFSSYERLDNIDYTNLHALAEGFGLEKRALTFFSVHKQVDHFDVTKEELEEVWKSDPSKVKEAFKFIADNQFELWKNLSNEINNYH